MAAHRLRLVIGGMLVLVALGLLGWSLWPAPDVIRRIELTPNNQPETRSVLPELEIAGLELSHPAWQRTGERGRILLTSAGKPPLEPGKAATNAPQMAARLELPGVIVNPSGETYLLTGVQHLMVFSWQVAPDTPGSYSGTVWVHLLPAGSVGDPGGQRRLLSALPVQIEVISLAGLSNYEAQVLGLTGLLIGIILLFFRIRK